jgi:hypothetical protein
MMGYKWARNMKRRSNKIVHHVGLLYEYIRDAGSTKHLKTSYFTLYIVNVANSSQSSPLNVKRC